MGASGVCMGTVDGRGFRVARGKYKLTLDTRLSTRLER